MWFQMLTIWLALAGRSLASNRTYYNPILPGWHSDPSCVYVAEETFFCVTSTFIAFPALPLYASKDLQNWELASNIFNRPSQIPDLAQNQGQQGGIYAPTLRYRQGTFYLIVSYLGPENRGLLFTSTNPYSDAAWSEPLVFPVRGIDPDIFWDDDDDDDGKVYVTSAENQQIQHYTLDLETGQTGPVTLLWNGTGGVWPEGPHLYKKGGYYYLMIAEGGTETNHAETMARSRSRTGPWEPCPHNPVLTNRNTSEYFQTVGHADLFQDGQGNWWAVALATRSGPEWLTYPMGRETVLTPATWEEGQWPVLLPVRGVGVGPLPRPHRVRNPINAPEYIRFTSGELIPKNLMHWRLPDESAYGISSRGLRLSPSPFGPSYNESSPTDPITFLARRQTHTLFTFSVDLDFTPRYPHVEAGITVFLTQEQHVDLSIVKPGPDSNPDLKLSTTGKGNYNGSVPDMSIDIPRDWKNKPVSLSVRATDDSTYRFSAALASQPRKTIYVGKVDARVLSGGSGPFTGTLVGIYASRGGHVKHQDTAQGGSEEAYFRNWRYEGHGQRVDSDLIVPSY